MDKNYIIEQLRRKNEILPNEYDGTYRSVRKAMEFYAQLRKTSLINYSDLDLLYYLSRGIWENDKNERKVYIQKTHLLHNDKLLLDVSLDRIWNRSSRKLFNHVAEKQEMDFLTASFSFKDLPIAGNPEAIQSFFKMCINISELEDDGMLFDTVQKMISSQIRNSGMPVFALSRILHCLKPFTFPILGENVKDRDVFGYLGLKLESPDDISQYIGNCKMIHDFRNAEFKFKNMRVFEVMSWEILKEKNAPPKPVESVADHQLRNLNAPLNQILYGPPGTGKT